MAFELDRYHDPPNSTARPNELVRPRPRPRISCPGPQMGRQRPRRARHPALRGLRPNLNLSAGAKETLNFHLTSPKGLTVVKTSHLQRDAYSFDLAVR